MDKVKMECALSVVTSRGRLDYERMRLLEAVKETGSLNRAAESLGISYKTAWSWIDALHNASDTPLVESSHGGVERGQTRLTLAGLKLVNRYRRVLDMHRRVQSALERHVQDTSDLEGFLARLSFQTSARNHFYGAIAAIRGDNVQSWVDVQIAEGVLLTVRTTRVSIVDLGLSEGHEIAALCKATVVRLEPWGALGSLPGTTSVYRSPNRFAGQVLRVQPEDSVVEVVLGIGNGRTIAALVDPDRWHLVAAADPGKAIVHVDPSDIILARLL